MIERKHGKMRRFAGLMSSVLALSATAALAQQPSGSLGGKLGFVPAKKKAKVEPKPAADQKDAMENNPLQLKAVAVSPSSPIAMVNNHPITRQRLADECVAKYGKEVLDVLIARDIIDQALREKKIEITAAEVNEEIDRMANTIAKTSREQWLRTLEKERGISPAQYAREIIYPALALRKLAAPRVQVTQADLKEALDASFGDKIRCRLIMLSRQRDAMDVWEQLQRNPGAFETLARTKSVDMNSRALGGLIAEPISRHATPRNVSDAAFLQLVDGDPNDKDDSHKPKDGDITGPIQVNESTWIILKREELMAGDKTKTLKDSTIYKYLHDQMYEVKLKEKMAEVYQDLADAAAIENMMTGTVKPSHQEERQQVVGKVDLMSDVDKEVTPSSATSKGSAATNGPAAVGVRGVSRPPAGAPADDVINLKGGKN